MSRNNLPKRYLLRIELQGVHLPIWREIIIPSDIGLEDLDKAIQHSMGWSEEHDHVFIKDGVRFASMGLGADGLEKSEEFFDLDQLLKKPSDSMQYVYGFDEEWAHVLTLKKVLPWNEKEIFVCVDGGGACPLESCGDAVEHERWCRSGEIRFPEAFEPKRASQELADLLDFLMHEDEADAELFDEIVGDGLFDEDGDLDLPGLSLDGIEDSAMDLPGFLDADLEGDDEFEDLQHPYENLSKQDQGQFKWLFQTGELVRAAEPWKDLWDQDVFCVKDPETGFLDFVSVLGRGGEVFAIHVHSAPECYEYWRQTKEGTLPMDSVDDFLRLIRMTELEFVNKSELEDEDLDLYSKIGFKTPSRGRQKWMRVRRYHPRSMPYFSTADQLPRLIRGAQLAVRFVAAVRSEENRAQSKWVKVGEASAGLPEQLPVFTLPANCNENDWAAWELENQVIDWFPEGLADGSYQPSEFDIERIAGLPKVSQEWEVGAIHASKAFASETGPVIPVIAMAAPTVREGTPPAPYISTQVDESPGRCVWLAFVETALTRGELPKQLNVMTDVAEKTFKPFADQCGMKLKRVKKPKLIHRFFEIIGDSF